MTESDLLSFEYLLGRLPDEECQAFELEILENRRLQDDVFLSAMLIEMVKEYALVCSKDSFLEAY